LREETTHEAVGPPLLEFAGPLLFRRKTQLNLHGVTDLEEGFGDTFLKQVIHILLPGRLEGKDQILR
jgi:hypothetical protein